MDKETVVSPEEITVYNAAKESFEKVARVRKEEEAWRGALTADQFRVVRQKGTERPFTGEYWDSKKEGVYQCVACKTDLFSSAAKYNSATGWPSFFEPVAKANVEEKADTTLFMRRVEVVCAVCGGHLGHVFDDGPAPTGLRYCINSAALQFRDKE